MAVNLELDLILALCHPLEDDPWRGGKVTRAMVQRCLSKGRGQATPVLPDASAEQHAGRIAHFVMHGWLDPIEIDVGVPSHGCHVIWPVLDGNHRLSAAAIRGDKLILSEISGSIRHASELFGIALAQLYDRTAQHVAASIHNRRGTLSP